MSKILYAASTYSHIKSFHLEYIAALRQMGHEVLIMANGQEADFNVPFEKKIFSRKNTACRKQIAEIIRNENFDAILLNTTLAAFHIRLALPKSARPRVVNFVHGYLFSKNSSFFGRTAFLTCEKLLKEKTDAVIVMNSEDLDIATRHSLSKGKIFECRGMGVKQLIPTKTREEMRSELEFDGKTVITFVGELSKRKNQEFLINAMPALKKEIPNALLCLVGNGDERENLQSLVRQLSLADSVRFLGRREDVADILCATDVYVSAAKSEGLPFNIAEALSLCIPTVASDVKGHNDILKDSGAGILFAPDDTVGFIEATTKVYKQIFNPKKEDILAAYRKFSFDEVFPETLNTLAEALEL